MASTSSCSCPRTERTTRGSKGIERFSNIVSEQKTSRQGVLEGLRLFAGLSFYRSQNFLKPSRGPGIKRKLTINILNLVTMGTYGALVSPSTYVKANCAECTFTLYLHSSNSFQNILVRTELRAHFLIQERHNLFWSSACERRWVQEVS